MFFDDSRQDRAKRAARRDKHLRAVSLASSPIPAAKSYEFLTVEELTQKTLTLIFDVESYVNYYLVSFMCVETRRVVYFECFDDEGLTADQRAKLAFLLYRHKIIGFNSLNYDEPVMAASLQGLPPFKLKEITNEIIVEGVQARDIARKYNLQHMQTNHVDLIEVAPIEAPLKLYAARLHAERLQDLPFPPEAVLTREQIAVVRDYNINDLDVTWLLWDHLRPQLVLREALSAEFKIDLRSKSDAQISEAVIASELRKLGVTVSRPTIVPGHRFQYQIPDFVSFKTPNFNNLLDALRDGHFEVGESGRVECPQWLKSIRLTLGGGVYSSGIGGLHSNEKSVGHVADENTLLIDRDVASYYPAIKRICGLFPSHLGPEYLDVYGGLVDRRLKEKTGAKIALKNGDEALSITLSLSADGLKITINGAFGKLGDPYSVIYAPDLLIQVTLTGQLCLLMLIEMIELAGIPVVSANTDGIVIKCPKDRYTDLETVIIAWEERTGFVTEETRYKSIWSKDVSNYIAVKEDGSCKLKGVYAEVGSALNSPLSKNPEAYICSMAAQAYLAHGTPIAETVECGGVNVKAKHYPTPASRFVCVTRAKGGGHKDGIYLGKVVRWYYAKGEEGGITTLAHGSQVSGSWGGKPWMNITPELPADVDVDWYINRAVEILYEVGRYQKPTIGKLFA